MKKLWRKLSIPERIMLVLLSPILLPWVTLYNIMAKWVEVDSP